MLTMIVLLVLLYAMNGSFAVPTVCFVLSWIGIGFGAFDLILKLFLKAYEKHLDGGAFFIHFIFLKRSYPYDR